MARTEFTTNGTLSKMRAEFGRLSRPPVKTIFQLEQELQATFFDMQAHVHVITRSLKLSGRTQSDFDGDVWEGVITYGGPSTGVNNPVTYAIYERARGGSHDWINPAAIKHEPRFEAIINRHFKGGAY